MTSPKCRTGAKSSPVLKADLLTRGGGVYIGDGTSKLDGAKAEYSGVDAFFVGSQLAGLVSRSHTNQAFNVGNGGKEFPVLIVNPAGY